MSSYPDWCDTSSEQDAYDQAIDDHRSEQADLREEHRGEASAPMTPAEAARLDEWCLANGIPLEPPF